MQSGTPEPMPAWSRPTAIAIAWVLYTLPIFILAIMAPGCSDQPVEPQVQQQVRYTWINDEPKWSPSGHYLLYNHYPQTPAEEANGIYQIWSVDLATGTTQYRASGGNAQWMVSDAAFTFGTVTTSGVSRFDLASSQTAVLLDCAGATQASPDGRLLALVGGCASAGGPGLVLFDLATHSGRAIDSLSGGWFGSPAWSPNGAQLALSRIVDSSGFPHLWVVDTGGGGSTRLTPLDTHFEDRSATWSRDGNWIYWDRLGTSGYEAQSGIWRVHPDGTGAEMVVHDGYYPSFAPGDTAMAFTKFDSLHVFNIWICDKDGGNQRRLFAPSDSSAMAPATPLIEAHLPEAAYLVWQGRGPR